MSFCINCGTKINDTDLFCENCGTKVGVVSKESDQIAHPKVKKTKEKILLIIIAVLLSVIIIFSAFYYLPTSKKQLRKIGLDTIEELEYLVESDEAAELMSQIYGAIGVTEMRDRVDANDYDDPIAIYSLEAPSFEETLELSEDFDKSVWEDLPQKIKDSFEERYKSNNIALTLNGQVEGPEAIVFSSVYFANKQYKYLNIKEKITYLYVFEKGTPVIVFFNPSGYVTAYFLFVDCDFEDLSETKEFFDKVQYKVKRVYKED